MKAPVVLLEILHFLLKHQAINNPDTAAEVARLRANLNEVTKEESEASHHHPAPPPDPDGDEKKNGEKKEDDAQHDAGKTPQASKRFERGGR